MDMDWSAIEERALFDPVLQRMVYMVRHQGATKEQALIAAVLALSHANEQNLAWVKQLLERWPGGANL